MAVRDLGRNRRRSFFSALAVGLSLALLLLMAAVVKGEYGSAIATTIKLQSGHLQVRANSYDEAKASLKWENLIENPDQVAGQIAALPQVAAATPRLFASGFVSTGDESSGVRIVGVEPESAANDPYRNGLVSGSFLTADDRDGVLIGEALADKLGLQDGDQVDLSVNTSSGEADEQPFTVRGIYTTGTAGFDGYTVFLPLAKAQAITQTENRASAIFVLLKDGDQTAAVASALQSPEYSVLTWQEMNQLIVQTESFAQSYISILYLIVLVISASVVVNTLIMSVYERTREIGILAAIGMRGRRIMSLFLVESSLLAFGGIIIGVIIGEAAIYYWNNVAKGFDISNMGITMLISNRIFAIPTLNDAITLSIMALVVALIAGLYPAILAARMEPVDALRAEK
jgi:ABC-type lipoprotein release transport system permease subunit